jgi:hypothetical protein
MAMNEQRFPKGWDEQRVKRFIAELDARTEEEWIAEDEAAAADDGEHDSGRPKLATEGRFKTSHL